MRRTAFAMAGSAALIAIGLLGVSAFNPDDGIVFHSEPLWRVFGIGAYVGALTFWLSVVALLVLSVLTAWRGLRGG